MFLRRLMWQLSGGGGRWRGPSSSSSPPAPPPPPPPPPASPPSVALFWSHQQQEAGDWVHSAARELELEAGLLSWIDMDLDGNLDSSAMKQGVLGAEVFALVLTKAYTKSWFCGMELATAVVNGKRMVLVVETDPARGAVNSVDDALSVLVTMLHREAGNYVATPAHRAMLLNLTGSGLRAAFGRRVVHLDHSLAPSVFLRELVTVARLQFPARKVQVALPPQYAVLCDRTVAYDQARVLVLSTALFYGVYGVVLEPNREAAVAAELPLLLFVTDDVLRNREVLQVLRGRGDGRLVLAYENDGRRRGRSNGENDEAWWNTVLRGVDDELRAVVEVRMSSSVPYGKDERSVAFRGPFLRNLLDGLGLLEAPFDVPPAPPLPKPVWAPNSPQHPLVTEWGSLPGHSLALRGLVVVTAENERQSVLDSLPTGSVVAVANDLKSAAAACWHALHGFSRAFPMAKEDVKTELAKQGVEEQAKYLLSKPSRSVVFWGNPGKRVVVMDTLSSPDVARGLRAATDGFPVQFGVVVVVGSTDANAVLKPLNDFAVYDAQAKSWTRNAPVARSSVLAVDHHEMAENVPNVSVEWDAVVSYLSEEQDIARSLAMDMTRIGHLLVWFDKDREFDSVQSCLAGVAKSRVLVSVGNVGSTTWGRLEQRAAASVVDAFVLGVGARRVAVLKAVMDRAARASITPTSGTWFVTDLTVTTAPDLLLTGCMDEALDSLVNLQRALFAKGVSSATTFTARTALPTSTKALIVYLTKSTLSQPHVSALVALARRLGVPVLPIHDSDKRSTVSPLTAQNVFDAAGLLRVATDAVAKSVIDTSSIPHSAEARQRGASQVQFVTEIMKRVGLTDVGLLSASFNAFEIPVEKAREAEPGTREVVFEAVRTWHSGALKGASRVYVLLAAAGVGKSCIMAELCRRGSPALANVLGGAAHSETPVVGAFHFFRSSDIDHRSLETALRSLALQLRAFLGVHFVLPSKEDVDRIGDPIRLLSMLVLDPARRLPERPPRDVCVVLDALDECSSGDMVVPLIMAFSERAPSWLLLVVSSRPEDAITKSTAVFNPTVHTPSSEDNAKDLRVYLKRRLVKWGVREVNEVMQAVVEQSEGVFIWVRFQEPKIRDLCLQRAGHVTAAQIRALPVGMKNVYDEYFTALYVALGQNRARYRSVVSLALLTAREPVPEDIWRDALGFAVDEVGQEMFEREVIAPTSRLLLLDKSETNPGKRIVRPPHKSVIDWLTGTVDNDNSARGMGRDFLAVDVSPDDHASMSAACERAYQSFLDQGGRGRISHSSRDDAHVFGIRNAAYHSRSSCWVSDLERVFHWVHVGIAGDESKWSRLLADVQLVAEDGDIGLALTDVLRMSRNALLRDTRMLGGAVLGRVGTDMLADAVTQVPGLIRARSQAENLVQRLRSEEKVKLAVPVGQLSGLDQAGGALRLVLAGHTASVTSVCFSPDGARITSGSSDGSLCVWDTNSGREMSRLEGHSNGVTCVAYSPDGTRIASASLDNSVGVWNADTGARVCLFEDHTFMVWSVCFCPNGTRIVSGSTDCTIKLWDARTGELFRTLEGHTFTVFAVDFCRDGIHIASGSEDKTVRIWDAESGRELKRLMGHSRSVNSVKFAPAGDRVVSGSLDSLALVWDWELGIILARLEGHSETVNSVAFSFDGGRVVSGSQDRTVRVWDAGSGAMHHLFEGHSEAVTSTCFSPEGTYVLSGSQDCTARVWKWTAGRDLCKVAGHTGMVTTVSISPDGSRVASGSRDRTILVWDARTGSVLHKLEGHNGFVFSVSFAHDGSRLVSGSGLFDNSVRVWNCVSGQELLVLEGHADIVYSVAFSPDGLMIASGSGDGSVRVWNARTGQGLHVLEHLNVPHVMSLSFSSDGEGVLLPAEDGPTLKWDLRKPSSLPFAIEALPCAEPPANLRDDGSTLGFEMPPMSTHWSVRSMVSQPGVSIYVGCRENLVCVWRSE